ncbi:MAG: DUF3795 domain-containing protein [Kosmotoga sp.]|uniref:DUF3795 domain-containing protein n=1 Tax=Kosmotoga sp. TaxID=1955248 RepID=UPI001E136C1B|nr:DUF3795 domain-containing protein [Kosmotoga sp.]MBO8167079.1 DUF3795 domain-containing protein [Kosmotoga sp.]
MIAYCGIKCTECPAYIATINNDDAKRKEVAKEWSEMFNTKIKPEDINCKGCLNEEVLFAHCDECYYRSCAKEKGIRNCAYCSDFPCKELSSFFTQVPEAKETLENIRKRF